MVKRLTYTSFGSYDHVDADGGEISFSKSVAANICPCCGTSLREFKHLRSTETSLHLMLCTACGWWHLHRIMKTKLVDAAARFNAGNVVEARWWELHHAILTEITVNSPTLTIDQLRGHLTRFWRDRTHISAQQAEDLVADVLRDHYQCDVMRLTANANTADGGIDLVVASKDGIVCRAVQVKRRITREAESIRDVRDFVGGMLLSGYDKGVFVTTASSFTEPALAVPTNNGLVKHRLELELIDGERLLELLEWSNRHAVTKLPPLVELDQQWLRRDGSEISTSDLLFGDLARLSGTRSQ